MDIDHEQQFLCYEKSFWILETVLKFRIGIIFKYLKTICAWYDICNSLSPWYEYSITLKFVRFNKFNLWKKIAVSLND